MKGMWGQNWPTHLSPEADCVSSPPNTLIPEANEQMPGCVALAVFSIAFCWLLVFTFRRTCPCHPAPPEIMPKPQRVLTCLRKNRPESLLEFPENGCVWHWVGHPVWCLCSLDSQVKMCQVFEIGQAYDLIMVLSGMQPVVKQVFHPSSTVSFFMPVTSLSPAVWFWASC